MLAVTIKFLAYDTLIRRLDREYELDWAVVANWQFMAGMELAAVLAVLGRRLAKLVLPSAAAMATVLTLLAALAVVWDGSFEIDRYFAHPRPTLTMDLPQARQMAYSIWWAVYAAALLGIGLARTALRYASLTLFGVTLAKVFLVDMSGVQAGWRIGSFLALGAASWRRRCCSSGISAAVAKPETIETERVTHEQ